MSRCARAFVVAYPPDRSGRALQHSTRHTHTHTPKTRRREYTICCLCCTLNRRKNRAVDCAEGQTSTKSPTFQYRQIPPLCSMTCYLRDLCMYLWRYRGERVIRWTCCTLSTALVCSFFGAFCAGSCQSALCVQRLSQSLMLPGFCLQQFLPGAIHGPECTPSYPPRRLENNGVLKREVGDKMWHGGRRQCA